MLLRCCWCLLAVIVGAIAVFIALYVPESTADQKYRFGAFAPVRSGKAKWFVDGQEYMSAVADAIMSAKHEILITGWELNPHIFMKRPDTGLTSSEWRLDKILLKKANDGISVYILLYWGTSVAMEHGTIFVDAFLKHDNIEVCLYPTFTSLATHPKDIRWSNHEKVVVIDRRIAFVSGIDLAFGRWDTQSHDLHDNYPLHPCVLEEKECEPPFKEEPEKRYRRWIGKDYGNTLLGVDRTKLNRPFEDYINRYKDPRMPWHDISCSFHGDAVKDVVRHFIQRYNTINSYSWWEFLFVKWWNHQHRLSIEHWDHEPELETDPSYGVVDIQVLRSVGNWSAGHPNEDSIQQAYVHAIKNSEHFIYIENQYFISSLPNESYSEVHNEIQQALCDRIARAYVNSETFHVIIILPLQPEFSDEFGSGGPKDSITYFNYATLYNGKDSLYEKLKRRVPEEHLHSYFSVYSLRTHNFLNDRFVTEIIYVHSKLMIVDDRLSIIGSANINDRSMLGYRDSELNVIIEDREMIAGEMNGKPYDVGKFSYGLRYHLMKEHLGLLKEEAQGFKLDVRDPLVDNFYSKLHEIASSNTECYELVFYRKIIPTTKNVWSFDDMDDWKTHEGFAKMYPEQAEETLDKVQGHFVLFPPLHTFFKGDRVIKPSFLDNFDMFVDNNDYSSPKTVYV